MGKSLITAGLGFIGYHLTKHLLDDGEEDWGWSPRYSLGQAVENFISEVRANKAIYK